MRVIDEAMEKSREQDLLKAYRAGRRQRGEVILPAGLSRFSADPELLEAFLEGRDDVVFGNN